MEEGIIWKGRTEEKGGGSQISGMKRKEIERGNEGRKQNTVITKVRLMREYNRKD